MTECANERGIAGEFLPDRNMTLSVYITNPSSASTGNVNSDNGNSASRVRRSELATTTQPSARQNRKIRMTLSAHAAHQFIMIHNTEPSKLALMWSFISLTRDCCSDWDFSKGLLCWAGVIVICRMPLEYDGERAVA